MAGLKLKIGADPEMPVRSCKPGKPWVCADGLIPGTKEAPYLVPKGAIQVDGMAVEYNIEPALTKKEFIDNNMSVVVELSKRIPDYELVVKPCVTYGEGAWKKAPEHAKILGCDPDFNAYTGEVNDTPNGDVKYRTFSGHVHLGWTEGIEDNDKDHFDACTVLAKELDIYLGMPALLVDNGKDAAQRRNLYGKAGAFRPKSYGMEYRVLSNFWVGNEEYMAWVYDNIQLAFNNLLEGKTLTEVIQPREYIDNYKEYSLYSVDYICEKHDIPKPPFKYEE